MKKRFSKLFFLNPVSKAPSKQLLKVKIFTFFLGHRAPFVRFEGAISQTITEDFQHADCISFVSRIKKGKGHLFDHLSPCVSKLKCDLDLLRHILIIFLKSKGIPLLLVIGFINLTLSERMMTGHQDSPF
jgi:hypothetical protein